MADKIFSVADGLHDKLPSIQTAKAGRMLITTDRGEVYYEPEDKERIQVNPQADWQQNDETANDYVKNRPGGYEVLTDILPETTLNFTDSTSLALTNFPPIEVGKTYTVTFYKPDTDSVEYELIGRNDSRGLGYVCIGNENITWGGGTDTTTPFVIFTTIANTTNIVISSSSSIRTYNIKIKAIAPIKIDEKYLDIKNTNIINGSKIGSLRTVGSSIEGSEYKIGDYAFAEGQYTKASGAGSHAEGNNTTASGYVSHAEGYTTKASGDRSHAEGSSTKASGRSSHSEGMGTTASGSESHAEGNATTASGTNSHAEGNSSNLFSNVVTATNPTDNDIITAWESSKFSLAKGESAHVEGINSLALGSSSHAEGSATQAFGYSSHAEGFITKASAPHSHAEGASTKASGYASHAEGESTTASGSDSHAEGNNTKASGNRSHAEGDSTTALSNCSHAEGNNTIAGQMGFKVTACEKLTDTTGTYTLTSVDGLSVNQRYSVHLSSSKDNCGKITAINTDTNTITVDGYPNIALSPSSSSTANYITIVNNPHLGDIQINGDNSHAEGSGSKALGESSHAEGEYTIASGNCSHTEGDHTTASGYASHAECFDTTASDAYSHAEGFSTQATAPQSHAEGYYTTASGNHSHAEGQYTETYGQASHAEGSETIASSKYQHVQGRLNLEDSSNTYADIVGNGDEDSGARSNAYTLDWQGNAWYSGDIYVGSTSGTNKDEGSRKLATEIYANTISANAIKDSVSGLNVVQISDKNNNLCPVTHDMGIKVSSKNLWQNTNTTFPTALSYNSDNQTYTLNTGTAGYTFVAHTLDTPIPAGTTVTISIMFQSGKGKSVAIGGYHSTGGRSWQGYIAVPNNVDVAGQTLTSTFTTTETVETFRIFHNIGDNIEEPFIFKVQYELGSTATVYTPYIPDLTAVKVSRCGKNLCVDVNDRTDVFFSGSPTTTYNITGSQLIKGFAVNGNATNYHITDFVNSNGAVSFKTSNVNYTIGIDVEVVEGVTYAVSANITGGTSESKPIWIVFLKDGLFQSYTTAQSFTVPNNCNQAILLIRPSAANTECSFSNVQLELGTTATDYEPYKECVEYTPTADGTVEDVTSLYPNTTLMTDTDGVIIDCEYNVDLNSALDNINNDIGDINTALDSIIEMQNSLIGGN